MSMSVFTVRSIVVLAVILRSCGSALSDDTLDVYRQVTEVTELHGRARVWIERGLTIDLAQVDDPDLGGRFDFGVGLEFERDLRRSSLAEQGSSESDTTESAGNFTAALSFDSVFGKEDVFRRIEENVSASVGALPAQAFERPLASLKPQHLVIGESIVGDDEVRYRVVTCSRLGVSSKASVWIISSEGGGFEARMHGFEGEARDAVCGALADVVRDEPRIIEAAPEPVEIRSRQLTARYREREGSGPAMLPPGAEFGSWTETRTGSDATKPVEEETPEGRPSPGALTIVGWPSTPDTEIDPETLEDARAVLVRLTVTGIVDRFGRFVSRTETEVDHADVGWFVTTADAGFGTVTWLSAIAIELHARGVPLRASDLRDLLASHGGDNAFGIVCTRDDAGRPKAIYCIESGTGRVLNPEPVCGVLERALGPG